jgi:hypothetical protein
MCILHIIAIHLTRKPFYVFMYSAGSEWVRSGCGRVWRAVQRGVGGVGGAVEGDVGPVKWVGLGERLFWSGVEWSSGWWGGEGWGLVW